MFYEMLKGNASNILFTQRASTNILIWYYANKQLSRSKKRVNERTAMIS